METRGETGLVVEVRHRLGGIQLDAAFTAPAQGVTALFGPSGAGKTSLLRCVAGLLQPEQGRIQVGGEVWQDSASKVFRPPHRRGVGYVFQEASLFPHLTVRGNLRFALGRAPGRARGPGLDDVVDWLGLAPLLERSPGKLSGGERQRAAIARALLARPSVLLLDEPLSALDEASRQEILPCLEALHESLDIPVLYVSHLVREVARLARQVVFVREGRVTHSGPAPDMLREMVPGDTGEAAPFALIEAEILRHEPHYHLSESACAFGPLWIPGTVQPRGSRVWIQVFARDISVALRREEDISMLNQWPCRLAEAAEGAPGQMILKLLPQDGKGGEHLFAAITRKSWDALGLHPGMSVYARIKSVSMVE